MQTQFFHAMVNWRKKNNTIKGLIMNGKWSEEPLLVKEEVREYYLNSFKRIGG